MDIYEKELSALYDCLLNTHYSCSKHEFWERVFDYAVKGLNYNNDDMETNGEQYVMEYILNKMGSVNMIFDVGANVGKYTKILKNKFTNAKVWAFEPSKVTFHRLKLEVENIDGVSIFNLGFGSANEKNILYLNEEMSGVASLYKRDLKEYNIDMNMQEEVSIRTIDAFCDENYINTIDFLKIDVEGNEYDVLQGARNMIFGGRIPFIQFEFGGTDIDSRHFFRDYWRLLEDKYRFYRMYKDGIKEIVGYNEKYERYYLQNIFLELK